MTTFNSVANVSARNENKKKINPGNRAYVYMSGGVHSPDARPKKNITKAEPDFMLIFTLKKKELLRDQEKKCVNQEIKELLQKVFLKK